MNEDIQQLVQSFFGKNSIDDCNLQELQNAIREYPYSAPLQLILSEKMRSQHPSLYQKQLQKTSLYFHNILWFDYMVNKEEYFQEDFIISISPQKKADIEMYTDETLNGETWSPEHPEPVHSEEINPGTIIEQTITETETASSDIHENSMHETEILQSNSDPVEPSYIKQEIQQGHVPTDQPEQVAASITNKPVEEEETIPAFEPYHTVDYFASQGIKLKQEEKPKDRFGQQLKSFTEWLKTMKRLPQAEMGRNIDSGSEQKVQSLAEHSLQEPEVVTEAMAEVWEKQGNRQKAIELYTKLSLLNPGKSAYFAAKIEQLKKEIS